MKNIITLLFFAFLCSCAIKKSATDASQSKALEELYSLMSGEFSSQKQSELDTNYFSINLVMYPIWEEHQSAKWLYVEQAVTDYIKRPYRQRIYKVTQAKDGLLESAVFELPNPKSYIHAWENPALFKQITPDSLMVREGCSVFMKKNKEGCFVGSTKDKECKSTLRGATYATSEVTICEGQVLSWDRGWNDADEHIWGASLAGYVFDRKK